MKSHRILLILLAATAVYLSSCDELLGDLLKFNSEWYSMEFTITPDLPAGDTIFQSETFESDIDSVLNANGVSDELMRSARLSDARVTILTEGQNFNPLSKVELFIETTGRGKTRVAWVDPVPRDTTMIDLQLSLDDIQDFLREDSFIFSAGGTLDSPVATSLDILAEVRFVFKADLTE